jgi:hypothetical protein
LGKSGNLATGKYFYSTPLLIYGEYSSYNPTPTAITDLGLHNPPAHGKMYQTPTSITLTDVPKATREGESISDLGTRKRDQMVLANEAPLPRKQRRVNADAEGEKGIGNIWGGEAKPDVGDAGGSGKRGQRWGIRYVRERATRAVGYPVPIELRNDNPTL